MTALDISKQLNCKIKAVLDRTSTVNRNRRKYKDIQIINHLAGTQSKNSGDAIYEVIDKNTMVVPIVDNINSHTKRAITQIKEGMQDQYKLMGTTDEGKKIKKEILTSVFETEDILVKEIQRARLEQI